MFGNPRKTFIYICEKGIYYGKKSLIGKKKGKRYEHFTHEILLSDTMQTDNALSYVSRVNNASSYSKLNCRIVKNIKFSKSLFWVWLIITPCLIYILKEWGLFLTSCSFLALLPFLSARLIIDFDEQTELEWDQFTNAIGDIGKSRKKWLVLTSFYNSNIKYHSGAYQSVLREKAKVKIVKPYRWTGIRDKISVKTVWIGTDNCRVLFHPAGVIVKRGIKQYAYSYRELRLVPLKTRFVENGRVAKDANVVDFTWQFVNADGSPDRRFKNNWQHPVCEYGVLIIQSKDFNLELHTSNKDSVRKVDQIFRNYGDYLNRLIE